MSKRAVSIADLKNNLSAYLADVRRGEELLVRDRKTPFAKIVPLEAAEAGDAEEVLLAAEGKLKLPERRLPPAFFGTRAPKLTRARVLEAVRAEREED